MLRNLFYKLFGIKQERRSKREMIQDQVEVLFFIGEKAYKLRDVSLHGLSFFNSSDQPFELNSSHEGTLEFYGHDQCSIQFQIVRIDPQTKLIGCEVTPTTNYQSFLDDLKTYKMIVTSQKAKKFMKS